jgi:transaldolase
MLRGAVVTRIGRQDAMATEKLADGIRKFAADLEKLEKIVRAKLA